MIQLFKQSLAIAALVVFSSNSAFAGDKCTTAVRNAVTKMFQKIERPEPKEILELGAEPVLDFFNPITVKTDPTFLNVLEAFSTELLTSMNGRPVYLFARDGEWLYDALSTSLLLNPNGHTVLENIRLINVSRPVVENSSDKQIYRFLEANEMDIDAILQGTQQVVWMDTGERGSIFKGLYASLIRKIPANDPNWKEKVTNIFNGIDGRLMHTVGASNKEKVLKAILKAATFDPNQVISEIEEELIFPVYLQKERKSIGIPSHNDPLHDWIVEQFERRFHWNGRAQQLNATGSAVQSFQNIDKNPMEALQSQALIIRYFETAAARKRMAKVISTAASVFNPKTQAAPVAPAAPAVAVKLAGREFEAGEIIQTPGGSRYRVLEYVDKGKRGRVYKAHNLSNNQIVAVKVAVDSKGDTLKSFSEELEKNKGYKLAKAPHAEMVEIGSDFMVKEFKQGQRADQWIKTWVEEGMPDKSAQIKSLRKILVRAAGNGVYIGDLNPKNLIWTEDSWYIVDSGDYRSDLSEADILSRYEDKVASRWTKKLSKDVRTKFSQALNLQGAK